jgi:hypothetical protein
MIEGKNEFLSKKREHPDNDEIINKIFNSKETSNPK